MTALKLANVNKSFGEVQVLRAPNRGSVPDVARANVEMAAGPMVGRHVPND